MIEFYHQCRFEISGRLWSHTWIYIPKKHGQLTKIIYYSNWHVISLSCENWRFTIFQLEFWSENWRFFVDVFLVVFFSGSVDYHYIIINGLYWLMTTVSNLQLKVNDKIYFIYMYLIRKITMIGINTYRIYSPISRYFGSSILVQKSMSDL
jgi:hypothetical protein